MRTEVSHIEAAEFDHALREATERERALRWEEVAGICGHLVERLREASEPQARGMRALTPTEVSVRDARRAVRQAEAWPTGW